MPCRENSQAQPNGSVQPTASTPSTRVNRIQVLREDNLGRSSYSGNGTLPSYSGSGTLPEIKEGGVYHPSVGQLKKVLSGYSRFSGHPCAWAARLKLARCKNLLPASA